MGKIASCDIYGGGISVYWAVNDALHTSAYWVLYVLGVCLLSYKTLELRFCLYGKTAPYSSLLFILFLFYELTYIQLGHQANCWIKTRYRTMTNPIAIPYLLSTTWSTWSTHSQVGETDGTQLKVRVNLVISIKVGFTTLTVSCLTLLSICHRRQICRRYRFFF